MQGKISAADIQQIAKELGENFTAREIQEMIEAADRDRKFFSPMPLHCYLGIFKNGPKFILPCLICIRWSF